MSCCFNHPLQKLLRNFEKEILKSVKVVKTNASCFLDRNGAEPYFSNNVEYAGCEIYDHNEYVCPVNFGN